MMQRKNAFLAYDEIKIAERDWLAAGLMWMALGAVALGPFAAAAKAGRILFVFALALHTIEALYAAFRAQRAGLNARIWLLRTMVLGSLALLALAHFKKAPRVRRIR
ncbi:MAG: TMEM254 family protein [Candidatus Binataceae bacterium]